MSYNEKSEAIIKEEWLQRLEQFPFKQADMNRLIMNYLVTGESGSPARSHTKQLIKG